MEIKLISLSPLRGGGDPLRGKFPLLGFLNTSLIVQVLDYYDKFKKSGDPLKSPIDQTEFLEIMQVQNVKKIFTLKTTAYIKF